MAAQARFATVKFALASLILAAFAGGLGAVAQAKSPTDPMATGSASAVRVEQLPAHGRETYGLILKGGPFPFEKDGTVFGNRERLLPAQKRGYYREYTVKTPGSRDRGARRIVCGGPKEVPHTCYYTADHYASFRKIVE